MNIKLVWKCEGFFRYNISKWKYTTKFSEIFDAEFYDICVQLIPINWL